MKKEELIAELQRYLDGIAPVTSYLGLSEYTLPEKTTVGRARKALAWLKLVIQTPEWRELGKFRVYCSLERLRELVDTGQGDLREARLGNRLLEEVRIVLVSSSRASMFKPAQAGPGRPKGTSGKKVKSDTEE